MFTFFLNTGYISEYTNYWHSAWIIADILLCAIGIKSLVAETNANCWLVSLSSAHYRVAFTSRYADILVLCSQLKSFKLS